MFPLVIFEATNFPFSHQAPHLNDELSLDIRVENPNALLMIERVERKCLRKVSRMNLARLCGESLLTAHAIGDEIVRCLVGEALRVPRVLGY